MPHHRMTFADESASLYNLVIHTVVILLLLQAVEVGFVGGGVVVAVGPMVAGLVTGELVEGMVVISSVAASVTAAVG